MSVYPNALLFVFSGPCALQEKIIWFGESSVARTDVYPYAEELVRVRIRVVVIGVIIRRGKAGIWVGEGECGCCECDSVVVCCDVIGGGRY